MLDNTDHGLDAYIRQQFNIEETDIRRYSPLTLAYIGDGIYELVIRSIVVGKGNRPVNRLHQEASRYVKAQAQSAMMDILMPMLTSKEADVYRRGRNAKSYTTAKNASVNDYRRATGFEALMGYLYLNNELPRLISLVKEAVGQYIPNEREGAQTRNLY